MTTALFPGSFDPFTAGHEAILRRIAPLFNQVIVAVGVNSDKHCHYSPDERVALIRQRVADLSNVVATSYTGMTIDLCHSLDAKVIIRGLRNAKDLEYEQTITAVNHSLDPTIETLFVLADEQHRDISSTLEREKLLHPNPS